MVGVILMAAAPELPPWLERQGLVWGGGRCCVEQDGQRLMSKGKRMKTTCTRMVKKQLFSELQRARAMNRGGWPLNASSSSSGFSQGRFGHVSRGWSQL